MTHGGWEKTEEPKQARAITEPKPALRCQPLVPCWPTSPRSSLKGSLLCQKEQRKNKEQEEASGGKKLPQAPNAGADGPCQHQLEKIATKLYLITKNPRESSATTGPQERPCDVCIQAACGWPSGRVYSGTGGGKETSVQRGAEMYSYEVHWPGSETG